MVKFYNYIDSVRSCFRNYLFFCFFVENIILPNCNETCIMRLEHSLQGASRIIWQTFVNKNVFENSCFIESFFYYFKNSPELVTKQTIVILIHVNSCVNFYKMAKVCWNNQIQKIYSDIRFQVLLKKNYCTILKITIYWTRLFFDLMFYSENISNQFMNTYDDNWSRFWQQIFLYFFFILEFFVYDFKKNFTCNFSERKKLNLLFLIQFSSHHMKLSTVARGVERTGRTCTSHKNSLIE